MHKLRPRKSQLNDTITAAFWGPHSVKKDDLNEEFCRASFDLSAIKLMGLAYRNRLKSKHSFDPEDKQIVPAINTSPRRINPHKLLLSKWTAVNPVNREKHFIVTRVVQPEHPDEPIEWIDLQAVLSKRTQTLRWQVLLDPEAWRQGWKD